MMQVVQSTSQPPAGALAAIASDIKLSHSVFAMPFALLAAFMAASGGGNIEWGRFGGQLTLIVLAMIFARTCAMLANRWLDREIDADNPRTAGRAIPSGRLSAGQALLALGVSGALFMGVCAAFGVMYGNWWPAMLGVPVLAWICAYGLFKRFTSMCHLWLGASLAISPLAAGIAIDPSSLTAQPALWLLAGMVLCWVAGFDIIYALQDVEVDRVQGLYSIPSRLGMRGAMWMSRVLHAGAVGCLIAALAMDHRFGAIFSAGVAAVVALLVIEHATVARWGTTKIALTFFTLNGVISCILGAMGILDVLLR
ncbi:MAG TPA: UbiA-like polyprenyltransferase [Phycisphaerales bacterium]|nr:UbiA-like polyprenyltransferase [Phycisphaerales bacterium]